MDKKRQNLLIIAVDTPNTPIRETARQEVRNVLRKILGDEALISLPGQAIRLARPDSTTGISVSHEAGLSLVAVHFAGPVGIDLLRPPESALWHEQLLTLAADYLGPDVAQSLAGLAPAAQMQYFAAAWTQHEARLKYLGLGLQEWQPALAERLSACRVEQLALPAGYVGAVAY